MDNPSLTTEPRYQAAPLLPASSEVSILDWLESTGRLIARDVNDPEYAPDNDDEIAAIMGADDSAYADDDDDMDDDIEDD